MPISGRLPNPGTIIGILAPMQDISVTLSPVDTIVATITQGDIKERYSGEYIVVPKAYNAQTLYTKNKLLKQDVVVTEIPTYTTSNDNGTTFIIGD